MSLPKFNFANLAQKVINEVNYHHMRRLEMINDIGLKPTSVRLSPSPVSERKIERPYSLQKHLAMMMAKKKD